MPKTIFTFNNSPTSIRGKVRFGRPLPPPYSIGGASPELVAAFLTAANGTTEGEYFRTSSATDDFSMFTFSTSNNRTMFDNTGTLVWAPHNLAEDSEDISQWSATRGGGNPFPVVTANAAEAPDGTMTADLVVFDKTVDPTSFCRVGTSASPLVVGVEYTLKFWVRTSDGTSKTAYLQPLNTDLGIEYPAVTGDWQLIEYTFTATGTSSTVLFGLRGTNSDDTLSVYFWGCHVYRSDLGGMADNPDQTVSGLEKYVPTTSAAVYLSRRNAYYYNGTAWTKGGLQLESAAATQLLHGTDSFATQDETVTAQAYTLQFRGTGEIVLSGAHSATLTGTGANDLVSLTFTPSAGTLTLTPSGTVNYPQLEVGSIPTSYIPNTAASGTVTRAAETLSIAGADTPANTTAMSISMKGLMTYADESAAAQETFLRWYTDANNFITLDLDTDSTATGEVNANQSAAGTLDTVVAGAEYSPGVNVAFNIASRHTSGAINVAKDGTAATADTTPTALADLSSATLTLGYDFNGFISELRMWGTDIGDSGVEEVTA